MPLPFRAGALRFGVIGDSGRWSREQQELARQLAAARDRFRFDFVLMLGDNNYGDGSPESFRRRFEEPYEPLIEQGVRFYAALGNHDADIGDSTYPLFNMGGRRYFSFVKPSMPIPRLVTTTAAFFALDTNRLDRAQLDWFAAELSRARADWKIVFMHHPLYTSGRYGFSSLVLRHTLEPLLIRSGVAVVFAGHEHLYERMVPQGGVIHFVAGGSGSVRQGDLRPSSALASGYDRDLTFMLVELTENVLHFQTVNRVGEIVDSGRIVEDRGNLMTRKAGGR